MEEVWYYRALAAQMSLACVVFVALLRMAAPYGRHAPSSPSAAWGPRLPARPTWAVMESPALWLTPLLFLRGASAGAPVPRLLLAFFLAHYAHRTLLYPLRLPPSAARVPLLIAAQSAAFNALNAYLQARWLSHFGSYAPRWPADPRFAAGAALFAAGMALNIWADSILIALRSNSNRSSSSSSSTMMNNHEDDEHGGYKLPPRVGLFKLVVCPNYAGELLEWLGFVLLTWSPAALAFFAFTFANLVPRALAHRRWYIARFPGRFDPSTRAVIPFLL